MARLTVLGSGSKGNCYILECEDITLILEIGVSWKRILQGLNYDLDRKIFALCTHEHGDHINRGTLRECVNYQIPVYSTISASAGCTGVKPLKPKSIYKLGKSSIMPMVVPHGECPCYSYLIMHPEFGNLIFATDLSAFPYRLDKVDHLFIECNNSEDVILSNMEKGIFSPSRSEDHLNLERCMETISRLRSPRMKTIMLMHLSSGNSDSEMFSQEVVRRFGVKPIIASSGVSFDISKDEF